MLSVKPLAFADGVKSERDGERDEVRHFQMPPASQVQGSRRMCLDDAQGGADSPLEASVAGPFHHPEMPCKRFPVTPGVEQSGGIHENDQADAGPAHGARNGSILPHPPGVQDEPVDVQGLPPFGVFQIGIVGTDEVGIVSFLGGCGHDGLALHAQLPESLAEGPGIAAEKSMIALKGNGCAGVPFHNGSTMRGFWRQDMEFLKEGTHGLKPRGRGITGLKEFRAVGPHGGPAVFFFKGGAQRLGQPFG